MQVRKLLKYRREEDQSGANLRLFTAVGRLFVGEEDVLTVVETSFAKWRERKHLVVKVDTIPHVLLSHPFPSKVDAFVEENVTKFNFS